MNKLFIIFLIFWCLSGACLYSYSIYLLKSTYTKSFGLSDIIISFISMHLGLFCLYFIYDSMKFVDEIDKVNGKYGQKWWQRKNETKN